MILNNEFYNVKIIKTTVTLSDEDRFDGDFIYNLDDYKKEELVAILNISVNSKDSNINISLITDILTVEEKCAVLEENILTVLQNQTVTQLNLEDGSVILNEHLNEYGCLWHIFSFNGNYLIRGEQAILMVDGSFNLIWDFWGKDIFASCTGKEAFTLCESSIKLYDFDDNFYEITFDGKKIKEILNE